MAKGLMYASSSINHLCDAGCWQRRGGRRTGAVLVGLMILIFLRDWRSSLIVVCNIPLAILAAVLALWLTGQTIN